MRFVLAPLFFGRARVAVAIVGGAALAGSCIATAPDGLDFVTAQGGEGGGLAVGQGGQGNEGFGGLPDGDPHAVVGAQPSHGPFAGGQHIVVHGNGFGTDVRVWFDDVEIDATEVTAIDPTRVQVTAPSFEAGPVDITAQNGTDESTRRTLVAGYVYDKVYASPSLGPLSGGNEIRIFGYGTSFSSNTAATIDQNPCTTLTAASPTELICVVPPGSNGAKPLAVTDGGDTSVVLDGYTYSDSEDGYAGGLSGAPLDGTLNVFVYNNFTGEPIPGAHVIAGSKIETAVVAQTDANGYVSVSDASLDQPTTLTVAASCHSPITLVDVPVDTATMYLDSVLTPACASDGDPPPVGGGNPVFFGVVRGEIYWPGAGGGEFEKAPWAIPSPQGSSEFQRAYLFEAANGPDSDFFVPSAVNAVTPFAPGDLGYEFTFSAPPGNRTLYAIAGIQNTASGNFYAYTMGVVSGVFVASQEVTDNVFIEMASPLDQVLTLELDPPTPGPKGPDRIVSNVALRLGNSGYAILPNAQKAELLPLPGNALSFAGVPQLTGDLYGFEYAISARAATGTSETAPLSVVRDRLAKNAAFPVDMGSFVAVPTLTTPANGNAWNGTSLATTFAGSPAPIDMTVYEIATDGALWRWRIAVPKASHDVEIPDLSGFEGAHLPKGPLVITVYGAAYESFDYGQLRYRQLRPVGMDAYAVDSFGSFQ